ncbi:MAG: sugar phosphate isomerase/epimerase [Planctomycetia bacterium]|nr:sugar phosphate isomerase/epimerase [Planctomycetia bacterium]
MLLGYNTNGLAHHDPYQAVELLAELGYRSVGLTIDHGLLNPYGGHVQSRIKQMRRTLEQFGMRSVVETGARYLLDARKKHEPTLMTSEPDGRAERVEFYKHCIDAAAELGSDCVSLWSGILRDGVDDATAMRRLTGGLREVLDYAEAKQITIGFEPEPGMFIDTLARYDELLRNVDHPRLRLTLDIGHLHCQGETPIAAQIESRGAQIVNIHIEDMRADVHEHLMFGEGEIDFFPVLKALLRIGYAGGVYVELSRHSHDGPNAAAQAFSFLSDKLAQLRR